MSNTPISSPLWPKLRELFVYDPASDFSVDISRIGFSDGFLSEMKPKMEAALREMVGVEEGKTANQDEDRMVGHYWLRDAALAPTTEIRREIEDTVSSIQDFAARVRSGELSGSTGKPITSILVIGIGGSALGPQFVLQALRSPKEKIATFFFDNTDPDGMHRVIQDIPDLATTLGIVISKSGGTKETRNGQLIFKEAVKAQGLSFAKHMVAITGKGSELDRTASAEQWLARFPMWDWVGGRTSELSAVGLLPGAIAGFDIVQMLSGAKAMDSLTRQSDIRMNPAAMLALAWYQVGGGKGLKDMVVLPYNDRLELFSRYLQQLVMESLGKAQDRDGNKVEQGIAVYGNKGSTDQHAYVQQLRDGVSNFFAVFIEVLTDTSKQTSKSSFDPSKYEVEEGTTCGDYLHGFLQGTRQALYDNGRESITVTVKEVSAFSVGQLIALFERAVGLYASLINVNAYHQPGVEAGKKAAATILELQGQILSHFKASKEKIAVVDLAAQIGFAGKEDAVFGIVRHLAANGRLRVELSKDVFDNLYYL